MYIQFTVRALRELLSIYVYTVYLLLFRADLVGCFGFNGPLRQYFSLYRAVSQREGEIGERIDESKNVLTTPHPHLLQAQ